MERCKKCILPMENSSISFNSEGVCSLCESYKSKVVLGVDSLRKEISRHLPSNKKYDCIVPISGGRDSCYILFWAVREFGLKPLAVHFDNGFHSEHGRKNLLNATSILGVDLISKKPDGNLMEKLVPGGIKLGYAHRQPAMMGDLMCTGCGYAHSAFVKQISTKQDIPMILWGDETTESSTVMNWESWKLDLREKLFSRGIINRIKWNYHLKKLKSMVCPVPGRSTADIHVFDYIVWDRKKIIKTITSELKWEKPDDSVSSWRTDCKLSSIGDILLKKAFGAGKFEVGFSNMIRSGQMSRDEALSQIEKMPGIEIPKIQNTLKEMKIPQEIIDWIISPDSV